MTELPAVLSLIGNTPLIPLHFPAEGVTIYAKAEFLNPSGSIKDRLAKSLILEARHRGALQPDSIILECTSGNTGIALAMVGASLGYAVHIVMSSSASMERRHLMRRLGAEITIFDGCASYQAGIDLTREMATANPRFWLPRQFENPLNAADHEETTALEIISQCPARVDAFVNGYGTGGTIAGVGKRLKAEWSDVRIVAMEPGSGFQPGECPCSHIIEGVAQSYVPPLVLTAPIDQRIPVNGTAAMAMTRRLHQDFGLLVGTSSGANLVAALQVAKEMGPTATIVTILCDRAERYFSTALFA
jgi:cysteine synthase A